ncbi:hypothetical protein [Thermovenabulum sp.]|uniref:hypothetical protein n=1 Tax=Thermovenabulum sp. TaxID=3100335 RepID=UPI003C7AF606
MRKKIFIMVVILALLLIAACGGEKTGQKPAENTNQAQKNEEGEKEQPAAQTQNSEMTMKTGTEGKSAELPAKYPSEIFPLYKDSFILTAIELDGGYTITAYSKEDVKVVMEFYKKVLEGAKVTNETLTEESLTSFGSKSGYTYQLDVAKNNEMKGYNTSIAIMLIPGK